jgi:hypothetical protein
MRDRESARESERERRERKERERERERESKIARERARRRREARRVSVSPHTCASDMRNASTTFPRAACNYSLNPQP